MSDLVLSVKHSSDSAATSTHFHDCNQLLFVKSGAACVTVNGERFTAPAGSLVITNRFERHSITAKTEYYERYVLRISPSPVSLKETDEMLLSVLVNRPESFCNVIDVSPCAGEYIDILNDMEKEYSVGGKLSGYVLELLLYRLLALLYRYRPELFSEYEKGLSEIVRKIKNDFSGNYSAEYTLEGIAAEYSLSPSYLAHSFKKITGTSVMNYLRLCRITAAKKLLASSDMPVSRIVASCGFSDHSNFSREFRQETGISPTEFRNIYKNR